MEYRNKVISFSIWGDNPYYLSGLIANLDLVGKYYPGWNCFVYCDSSIPQDINNYIKSKNCTLIEKTIISSPYEGAFWRFLPASLPDVDVFIVRDADSRLNDRERQAVKQWLDSSFPLHTMWDNIAHTAPIMAGMWGCKNPILKEMEAYIESWPNKTYKGTDQDFLLHTVWSKYSEQFLGHDKFCKIDDSRCARYRFGFNNAIPFPDHAPFNSGSFVGQSTRLDGTFDD